MNHPLFSLFGGRRSAFVLLGLASLASVSPLLAHEGHDHGAPVPVLAGQPVQPQFAVASEEFEVVGVLADDGLTLYLDETASNRPLDGATLEVASTVLSGVAAPAAAGTYRLPLKAPLAAGKHALTLTVVTAESSDLLSATLEVGAAAPAPSPSVASRGQPLLIGGAALLLAVVGGVFYFRRQQRPAGAAGK